LSIYGTFVSLEVKAAFHCQCTNTIGLHSFSVSLTEDCLVTIMRLKLFLKFTYPVTLFTRASCELVTEYVVYLPVCHSVRPLRYTPSHGLSQEDCL